MLTAPLKVGESPRAKPVMIPTHTSKAPAAAVERSFKSWFTGQDLFSEGAAQGTTRATGQVANSLYSPKLVEKSNSAQLAVAISGGLPRQTVRRSFPK